MASIPRGEEQYDSARAIQLAMVAACSAWPSPTLSVFVARFLSETKGRQLEDMA